MDSLIFIQPVPSTSTKWNKEEIAPALKYLATQQQELSWLCSLPCIVPESLGGRSGCSLGGLALLFGL